MRRMLIVLVLALLFASCKKGEPNFLQSNSGSTGTSSSSSAGGGASSAGASSTSSGGASGGEAAERPTPTAAQLAALEGGQEVKWDQQGMTWTLPKGWVKETAETTSFNYRSAGGGDFAFLIVNVSPMGADFPTDISLKAFYDQAVTRKKNGEVEEVRWVELDGVKGVEFREAMPEGQEDPRRLQWLAYRKYAGQTQMVNLMLSTKGRSFEKYQDTLYGILYSTRLGH